MAHPIHKHMHTHITKRNVEAAIRDNKAHMDYLKRDVKDDQRTGGKYKDINQTADEKHISKLAGDIKYDKKKEGLSRNSSSPLNVPDRESYIRAGGTDPYGGGRVPYDSSGKISLSEKELAEGRSQGGPRATGLGSIDAAEAAGTTSMPDWNYEGADLSSVTHGSTEMGTEAAQDQLKFNAIDDITQGDGKADRMKNANEKWQSIVNAKRAAGIGYAADYTETDADGNMIPGIRFDDGEFLPD